MFKLLMKVSRVHRGLASLAVGSLSLGIAHADELKLPYAQVGLSASQAATILLDRFTYGARSGEAQQLVEQGLGRWFELQLAATAPETGLGTRLSQYPALGMTHQQLFGKFPSGSQGTAHARRFYDLVPPADAKVDFAWSNRKLAQFRKEQGYQSQETELYQQLAGQKLVRAVYAQNQLNEVLTEFWYNHFYVASSNFRSRPWVLAYEAEALRPHALGNFRELLGATARHPARIQATLGDAEPATVKPAETTMGLAFVRLERQGQQVTIKAVRQQLDAIATEEDLLLQKRFWPAAGNNMEFARLLLQQTVGSQSFKPDDLQETARIFTGWATLPYGVNEQWFKGGFAVAAAAGFVQQGSFVFRADRHDALAKQVLGRRFAAGGGHEEGEQLLDLLASHPATATHIAKALAAQFVGANPDPSLVAVLAASFRKSNGDLRQVMRTLVQSKLFWREAAAREQQKSPLQYAASALRTSQAELGDTQALTRWLADMGQPLYAYLDSNGPPQNRQWLSAGQFTARMNFAQALGNGQIDGIQLPKSPMNSGEQLAMQIASPQFQLR